MANNDTNTLRLYPNLADADGFYDELLQVHQELSDEENQQFHARLILILCNHIGDRTILTQAFEAARLSPPSEKESE